MALDLLTKKSWADLHIPAALLACVLIDKKNVPLPLPLQLISHFVDVSCNNLATDSPIESVNLFL